MIRSMSFLPSSAPGGRAPVVSAVRLFANRSVVQIGDERDVARGLQRGSGNSPPSLLLGTVFRGEHGGLRKPGEARRIREHELPLHRGVEHVLSELRGELRQLPADGLQARLAGFAQLGAVAPEVVHRLLQEARGRR